MYLSAAFDRLYPDGAGFPEPEKRNEAGWINTDAAGFGITFIANVFPRVSYGQSFDPAIFPQNTPWTRTLWPLYTSLAQKTASGSVLVSIEDAITFGPVIYAGANHRRSVVYETHRPNDRAVAQLAQPSQIDGDRPFDFASDADYMFFASVGSFNYGHFLVDDLPRLKAIHALRAVNGSRRIVIVMISYGAAIDDIRASAIRRIAGTPLEIQFLPLSQAFRFERLYYVTPVSSHPVEKNPLALNYIIDRAVATIGIEQNPTSKLLVLRKASNLRVLQNQAEIVDHLIPLGFDTVYPEDLSFEDQVRRFAGAAVIVGQMGASMTNTMFASSTAKLVYLTPAGWIEPFYWDLALARHQSYCSIYGTVMTHGRPIHESEFIAPTADVITALSGF